MYVLTWLGVSMNILRKHKSNIYKKGFGNLGNVKYGFNTPCPVCGKHIEKEEIGKHLWINKGEHKFIDVCSSNCLEYIFNLGRL